MFDWEYLDETFIYDGSFFGLLTIVFDSYINGRLPANIYPEDDYEYNILDKTIYIETDEEKAQRIFDGLIKNVSFDALFCVYNAFLNGQKNKELTILKFALAAFKVGPEIGNMLSVDYVMDAMMLRRATVFEAHRFKGLLRFNQVSDNLYYASFHPDHNIIEHVGKHFVKRLPTMNFIIHDKKRGLSFIYDTKEFKVMDVPDGLVVPEFSDEENLYQDLWKVFFKSIAIKERTNKKLQMRIHA